MEQSSLTHNIKQRTNPTHILYVQYGIVTLHVLIINLTTLIINLTIIIYLIDPSRKLKLSLDLIH